MNTGSDNVNSGIRYNIIVYFGSDIYMKKRSVNKLIFYIVSAEAVGFLSAVFSGGFNDFYLSREKPPLLPPAWVFPLVWIILYAVMGFSAGLIQNSDSEGYEKKQALRLYWIQLFVNFFLGLFL